jgi:hypothetical protein
MNWQSWFNALCYELGLWAVSKRPSLALQPWFKQLMAWCRPDWAEWRTQTTLKAVDKQAAALSEQWKREHNQRVAEELSRKAQELFPASKISPLPHAIVPSVLIETAPPDDASEAVKALGGELRITYRLPDQGAP